MNLRHLEFFVELTHTERMAQAAESLGISQPSLSHAINSIEDELGVPLFEKEGHNIKLTSYGRIYLKHVEVNLNALEKGNEYVTELHDINQGHIHSGFTYTMGQDLAPELVSTFKNNPTAKKIIFSYSQDIADKLIEELLEEKLDLAFASKVTTPVLIAQVNQFHLVNQELLAAVPFNHLFAKKDEVTFSELVKYPMVFYQRNSGLGTFFKKIFDQTNIKPKAAVEAQEDHSVLGLVRYNLGVAIVPHMLQLSSGIARLLPIKDKAVVHPTYAIIKVNHFLPSVMQRFQSYVEKYCRNSFNEKNTMI